MYFIQKQITGVCNQDRHNTISMILMLHTHTHTHTTNVLDLLVHELDMTSLKKLKNSNDVCIPVQQAVSLAHNGGPTLSDMTRAFILCDP